MTKLISAFAVAAFTLNAHATVWFGFTDSKYHPVIVGLSSGPIAVGPEDHAGMVGHFRLQKHFIGMGAYPLSTEEFEDAKQLELESANSEEFIAKLGREFPSRRFIVGALDGKILATKGETGCNDTNPYCGIETSGSFHIVGGGLIDQHVLLDPLRTYEHEYSRSSGPELACKIIDALVAAGGEIKEFQNGVIWTSAENGETLIKEELPEHELIPKLKARYCPN
jgi:hypothetical protein